MADSSSQADPKKLREAAVTTARKLIEAGHMAYFAGGCVRDRLLGIEPSDYDIATEARPEQVAAVFPKVHTVGEAFAVMQVRQLGHMIQIATFRTDGVYTDSRHPDSVSFSDAEHDAQRRDFTINGLFEEPLTGKVIDYVGGQSDLEAKIVRAIGDPHARLREDRLRMLRAVRFAARFGFDIEEETATAIRESAAELKGVSRERIGQELKRMLSDANRAYAAWELQYLGLDEAVLQEPHQTLAPKRVGYLPEDAPYPTVLAAWILDRHAEAEADLVGVAARWASSLMLSNEERFGVSRALEIFTILNTTWPSLGVAAQKRLASTPEFDQAVLVLQATDRQMFVDVRRRVIDLSETGLAPSPLIDGQDLIDMGMKPGPRFSRVLAAVYDAQLEGSVSDKDQALAMARAVAEAERGRS